MAVTGKRPCLRFHARQWSVEVIDFSGNIVDKITGFGLSIHDGISSPCQRLIYMNRNENGAGVRIVR